jgi:ankyrin repeat protein
MRRLLTLPLLFASLFLLPSCRRKTATPLPSPSQPVAERAGTADAARPSDEAALRAAAGKGDTATVKVLLDEGVNVNAKDGDGRTALTEAAFWGHADIVKLLLDKGADVFAKKNDGATPSTMAAGHPEIAEMIRREIQLLDVAGKGENKTVKELLDKGAYVNVRDPEGRTPLTEAAWNNHVETVKLLLEKGADPNLKKVDGATPLSIATNKGYKEIVELLKKAGAK